MLPAAEQIRPMNNGLLTEPELMHWFDCKRRADLERYLRKQGIPVLYGRKGAICTTLQAINTTMGAEAHSHNDIEFD